MKTITIDAVEQEFLNKKTPRLLFGDDHEATYKLLRVSTHPDKNPGDTRAAGLFAKIEEWYNRLKTPTQPIKSPKREYEPIELLCAGDVADIHSAISGGKDYLLKISRVDGGDKLLDNEQKTLTALLSKSVGDSYSRYLPTIAESFLAKDKIQKRINVFVKEEGFYTLEEIHAQHPKLDGRHLAWLFKRLLTIVGFVGKSGFVHGAILPTHVMVNPDTHGIQLIGWGHSVPVRAAIKTISAKFKGWYPTEVLKKRDVYSNTDLFMAAKCIVYAAGGDPITGSLPNDLPLKMRNFFKSCLLDSQTMRPDDAWTVLDDFEEILKQVYGKPKFHHLVMEKRHGY